MEKLYETTELSGMFFDGLSLIISSSHHALVIKKENCHRLAIPCSNTLRNNVQNTKLDSYR